jgi:hypothetical protein
MGSHPCSRNTSKYNHIHQLKTDCDANQETYTAKVTTEDGLNKKRVKSMNTWTMLLHARLRLWLKADKQ